MSSLSPSGPPSPQPLTTSAVDEYRTIMTRVDPYDWDGHKQRVETARQLATRAFKERDRGAWEVAQLIEWRLQRRNQLRPTEPGDVHVLDAMYRIEEAACQPVETPVHLSPREFTERLSDDCYALNALETPYLKALRTGKMTADDLKYFAQQLLAPSGDFTRMLAILSVRFPFELSLSVFSNLYEEAGEGDSSKAHVKLMNNFAIQMGAKTDEESLLDWTCPEILANTNVQNRMLWHYELGWSLGSMFLMERLLPPEFGLIREGLIAGGVAKEYLAWFDIHLTADEGHAAAWLDIVEQHLTTPEDRRIAYGAAMERGSWNRLGWEALYPAWMHLKETGKPPRVPARELFEATGI